MKKLSLEFGENNPVLRTVAEPIKLTEINNYKPLAESMLKYVKNPKNGGVGLAAPQVGISKRLIVVSLMKDYEDENFRTIAMINPIITEKSETFCSDNEWCLSLPGLTGPVSRPDAITVEFLDTAGRKYILSLKDLAARIVQHEIDHLDGILFVDRAEEVHEKTPEN